MVPQVRVRVLDVTWVGQFPEKSKTEYEESQAASDE